MFFVWKALMKSPKEDVRIVWSSSIEPELSTTKSKSTIGRLIAGGLNSFDPSFATTVGVGEGTGVVGVGEGCAVTVGVGEGVTVAVGVGEGVTVTVGVGEGVTVTVGVGEGFTVGVGDGAGFVGVGLGAGLVGFGTGEDFGLSLSSSFRPSGLIEKSVALQAERPITANAVNAYRR